MSRQESLACKAAPLEQCDRRAVGHHDQGFDAAEPTVREAEFTAASTAALMIPTPIVRSEVVGQFGRRLVGVDSRVPTGTDQNVVARSRQRPPAGTRD